MPRKNIIILNGPSAVGSLLSNVLLDKGFQFFLNGHTRHKKTRIRNHFSKLFTSKIYRLNKPNPNRA